MAYLWSNDLQTGNSLIDSQHKQLFEAINKLLEACAGGQGRAQINSTLDFLINYTAKHFADEERLQQQYGYPDHANHKRYHATFTATVRDLATQLKQEGPTIVLVGKVNTSIGNWLVTHIKREDMKVAAHIRSNS